ncbi:MAG: NAD-dependent epimerase/dehydratase family protein [Patescibacteria group bacterium]|nr:NAD-dependent epimerase/dehydratase family protein [Patescibacteria group bacterium]MDE2015273.1 NAD-dependent epimerase/dehydratase family protein [Patescibacteria group bacterium]MDE2227079.1 NAD-dependent epimerase/dehydratase family protein [Patescibacteria group bacterium]
MPRKEMVLITGGAGFIGSHTADALKKRGFRVRILDSLAPPVHNGKWPNYVRGKGFELICGDVRNRKDWEKALRGVNYVYHLAAYQDQRPDFSKFFHTNTVGTALLYEVIVEKKLPVKKIVTASTQFVYGDGMYRCPHNGRLFFPELRSERQFKSKKFDILCPHGRPAEFTPFKEEQQLTPTNSYGLSKEAIENLSLRFGKTYGIPTTLLRYSIVQGPRQSPRNLYSGALRIFVTQALAENPITVYEDGNELRDFVNIKDVVAANLLVLKNKKTDFQIYNVGGGKAYRVLDFAKLVQKMTGTTSMIKIGGFRRTDTRNAVSDVSKLKKLGWRPKFTTTDSVADYVGWYKENFLK